MNPLISIVLPVFNRANYLPATLDSIAAATLRPLELLLVDNGSTDNSLEVCQQWSGANENSEMVIRVLTEGKRGANAARNRGLKECRGEWVCFFDSDDWFCGEALTDLAAVVQEGRWDMAFLPVEQVVDGRAVQRAYSKKTEVSYHILSAMFSTHSTVFRTEWLRAMGGWNEDLMIWQDWELGVRCLLLHPRIAWLCQRSYHRVLIHDDSITGSSFGQTLQGTLHAMEVAKNDIEQGASDRSEKRRALRALYLRAMIMAGKLRKEGDMNGFSAYRDLASHIIPHASKPLQMFGIAISMYTAAGGRGAWKMAWKMA